MQPQFSSSMNSDCEHLLQYLQEMFFFRSVRIKEIESKENNNEKSSDSLRFR